MGPYKAQRSPAENETSLTIQVQIAAGTRRAQLPVPTGHRIIPSSVKLGDTPVGIRSSSFDEAIVDLTPADRILELSYRTAPGAPLSSLAGLGHVPEELRPRVEALRALPLPERPTVAWESIRHALRYAVDADTVARHAELASQGVPAVQRALRVGAGDCDAINGVLAVLLAAAGVEARLVVGPIGIQGRAGGMHAWVEYRHSGPWRALDATVTTAPPPGTRPADDQPVRAGPNPQSREPRPPEEGGAPISGILLLGIALASFSAVTASVLTLRRRRSSSHTQLDPRQGLAALLRGAIEHPQAFASAPAVFDRRLLPLRSGGRISLGEAWRLADGRRLHGARGVTGLARRAARGGHRVLDLRDPEAELVALTLGATDLDAWESALSRAPRRPLLQTVSLAVSGAGWELDLRSARVGPGQAPGPVSTLDLAIGSRGCLLTTAILWDDGSWLPELDGLFASRPAEATLRCAERVAEALALDDERCQEWRRRLARQALHEASR